MAVNQSGLGFLLIASFVGFACVIYMLLQYRKSFLQKNLLVTADQIWETIAGQAEKFNCKKSEMLFGMPQDASATNVCLVIKDFQNHIVGHVFSEMATRQQTIKVEHETFTIDFPLTWNRTAILRSALGEGIIAKYTQTSLLGQHEFEVTGYGTVKSERPTLSFKNIFIYQIGEKLIGITQAISSTREKGKLVVLPVSLPLEVRMFMLAV